MSTQKSNVIIVHGAGPKHYRSLADGSGNWQAQLPESLGSSFRVLSPEMPSLTKPSYEEWKILMHKYLARIEGEVTLVGHSLGGCFLLKYLSEEILSHRVKGLFLVALPLNSMKGFEAPVDYSKLLKIHNIVMYHSLDDVEVPYGHALINQERLKAKLNTYSDSGHFFKRSPFPEIAQDIIELNQTQNLPKAFIDLS